jgi:hypothetical protein
MLVLNEAIPIESQDNIKKILLGNNFPWYYVQDVTKNKGTNTGFRPAFFHNFVKDSQITSDYYEEVAEKIFMESCKKANIVPKQLLNCRSFLQLPLSGNILNNNFIDDFHVDLTSIHNVMIYYVKDNEACTLISKKIFTDGCDTVEEINLNDQKIDKIIPKQGKSIFFNGKYFHSAEQPLHSSRCILNFNFI